MFEFKGIVHCYGIKSSSAYPDTFGTPAPANISTAYYTRGSLKKGFSGGWERASVSCLCPLEQDSTFVAHIVFPGDSAGVDNSFQTLSCKGKENYGKVSRGRSGIERVCL